MEGIGGIDWVAARPLLATLAAIPLLLWAVLRLKIPAFAALIGVSLLAALAAGMDGETAYATITSGMGGTLGFIAVIIGLGSLFGALLEAGGGLPQLARTVLSGRGGFAGQTLTGLIGLLVAIPVFFDVALLILAPVVLALSRQSGRPVLAFGLPLLVGLAIAHAFIPPTPGPVAVAEIIGADIAWVILAGVLVGLPALIIAGPVLARFLERAGQLPDSILELGAEDDLPADPVGPGLVIALILLPVALILCQASLGLLGYSGPLAETFALIGHPFGALLIACAASALAVLGRSDVIRQRMNLAIANAFAPAGAVILVTGAGGAFKQVLVDTGAGAQLAEIFVGFGFAPLLMGYCLALIVRVAQGSATVAMITAAGMVAALIGDTAIGAFDLALIVTAIAAGASGVSHVNDSGFWLVSRIFNLSEAETLRSWTLATTVLSLTGLLVCLILAALI